MKYKLLVLFALLAAGALVFAGCGSGSAAKDDLSKIHVGIVFDIGGKDDRSFNAAAWQGVQRAAKDLPIVLRDIEPGTPNAIEPAMRAFAERHFDLIIGVGFAQAYEEGTGLSNLRQRLAAIYGDRAVLRVEPSSGATVVIEIRYEGADARAGR